MGRIERPSVLTVKHPMTTSTEALIALGNATITPNYAPAPIVFDRGEGMRLFDRDGREYLDFLAGIAVTSLGHNHPALVAAIQAQAAKLLHVSNAFFTEPQIQLQKRLTEISFADHVYFANSGAESVEAALKLARRYQQVVKQTPRFEIISFQKSFHGRSFGAVTATGQPKYHVGFGPIVPGFKYAPYNDLEAVKALVGAHTAAILLEPVQGEGGLMPADAAFLKGLRTLCDEEGILLILDEVQTGVGRVGEWFAYEHFGVVPDIMTIAKGIGGGVPLGAMVASAEVARGFEYGCHAATFGGNPLSTAAGLAVLNTIEEEGLLARAKASGEALRAGATTLMSRFGEIRAVRGIGAMSGIDLDVDASVAKQVLVAARERGLLFNTAGGNVLRFVPPLIAELEDVARALEIVEESLASVFHE